jgi:capsular exopolysaccharide synthesis family protein
LPRPGGANLAANTAIPVPGAPVPASTGGGMTGADVWRVMRANIWLFILMLIIGTGAGFGANYWLAKNHPQFTAVGVIGVRGQVEENDNGVLRDVNELNINTLPLEIRRHARLLKDETLFTQVLMNPNNEIRNTDWYRRYPTLKDQKEDLATEFEIAASPDSPLIEVTMKDSDPKSCQVIVQSIVDQYVKNQEDSNRDWQYNRNQELEQQRITQEDKLKLIDGDISDLQADLNTNGATGTMNKISTQDLELQELLKDLQSTKLEEQAAEEQYGAIVQQIEADPDQVPAVEEMVDKDPKVMELRQLESNYELNLATGASGGSMLPDSPMLQRMSKSKELVEQRLNDAESRARARYRTEILETYKERLTGLQHEVKSMEDQVKSIKEQTTQLTEHMEQLLQKQAERDLDEKKLNTIEDQLDQIQATSARHEFGDVSWAAQPELPDMPSFPKLSVVLTIGITVSLLLALGIAFLRELLDTSIRSPRDISRVGSLNLLGIVPHEDDDPQSAGARLPVVIFEAPHSMMAEQLRQVRTRLQHSSSLDTMRTILVTSPSPGDGKSTIACNLASGLALNGRRILLVDANFRRPELHRVFNLPNEVGFADVLNAMDQFEHAVQETQVPNLFVLPSGHKPSNATELVESQLLVDFIERALEEFDHVIFDSGPLLFVSETVALAPRVDGVVTVVRARINTRGVLTRMRDMLKQIKAEHLGVVLNAVRAQGGGYYGRNIRTYYEYQNNGGRAA